jgi:hypothetical protein
MEFKFRLTRKRTAAVVVIVALSAVGIGYAAIPDASGTYNACKLRSTGTIRLIDKSLPSSSLLSKCTVLEDEISWNKGGAIALGKDSVDSFMVKDGTLTSDDIGTGAVKSDELDGNSVTSDAIADGAVKNGELDGDAVTSNKIANGTVKGEDVATGADGLGSSNVVDGSLTGADLAGGSVTTDRQTANVASSLPGSATLVVPSVTSGTGTSDDSTTVTLVNSGSTAHRALLTGQVTFDCVNCIGGESISVAIEGREGATSVGPAVSGRISQNDPNLALPLTTLISVAPGVHTYTLHLTAPSPSLSADRLVLANNASLIAADLGR